MPLVQLGSRVGMFKERFYFYGTECSKISNAIVSCKKSLDNSEDLDQTASDEAVVQGLLCLLF